MFPFSNNEVDMQIDKYTVRNHTHLLVEELYKVIKSHI